MYIPAAFRVEDRRKLAAFVRRHSFATLITHDGVAPFASHVPMLFHAERGEQGTLVSHLARANPQWQHFASGREVLAIFHGPHSYISPSWYQTAPAVPTWNYAAVHAYGMPEIISERARIVSILEELIATYEAPMERPWAGELPEDYRDKMIQGIVAFEMPVRRMEGKFKLGQNRAAADMQGVLEALSAGDGESRAVAELMREEGYGI
jgi:transcriptional regulator